MGIAATKLPAKVPQLSWPRVGLRQTGRLPTCQGWGALNSAWGWLCSLKLHPCFKNASSWKSYWAHGKRSLSDSNTSSAQSWSDTLRMCLRCYTQVQDQTHIHSSSLAYFNCLNSSSKRQTNHDNSLPFNAILIEKVFGIGWLQDLHSAKELDAFLVSLAATGDATWP